VALAGGVTELEAREAHGCSASMARSPSRGMLNDKTDSRSNWPLLVLMVSGVMRALEVAMSPGFAVSLETEFGR